MSGRPQLFCGTSALLTYRFPKQGEYLDFATLKTIPYEWGGGLFSFVSLFVLLCKTWKIFCPPISKEYHTKTYGDDFSLKSNRVFFWGPKAEKLEAFYGFFFPVFTPKTRKDFQDLFGPYLLSRQSVLPQVFFRLSTYASSLVRDTTSVWIWWGSCRNYFTHGGAGPNPKVQWFQNLFGPYLLSRWSFLPDVFFRLITYTSNLVLDVTLFWIWRGSCRNHLTHGGKDSISQNGSPSIWGKILQGVGGRGGGKKISNIQVGSLKYRKTSNHCIKGGKKIRTL